MTFLAVTAVTSKTEIQMTDKVGNGEMLSVVMLF